MRGKVVEPLTSRRRIACAWGVGVWQDNHREALAPGTYVGKKAVLIQPPLPSQRQLGRGVFSASSVTSVSPELNFPG